MGESADQARVMARGLGAARVYIVPFDVAADLLVDSKPLLCASPVRCLDIRQAALPLHAEGVSLCVDVSVCGPSGRRRRSLPARRRRNRGRAERR